MKKLRRLVACGFACGINQEGIEGLNLTELNVWNNPNITSVSHMKQLRKLDASGSHCGIDQKGIANLYLEEININWNTKIRDVSLF